MAALAPSNSRFQLHPSHLLAIVGAIVLFFVVLSGKVRYTSGDSRYALLASQAILEHGTWRLDVYERELDLDALNHGKQWMIYRNKEVGHVYYDYPVGTSIFSLPFVAVARMWGMIPANAQQDGDLQLFIAATLVAMIFLLLFRMARLYLDDWAAIVFALLLVFGSSLMSVMGTALWSSNFETLFILLALLEIVEVSRGKRERVRGIWLGLLLFSAYICRPSAMFFILVVFGYLGWKQRKAVLPAAVVSGGLLVVFMLWSWLEMRSILPRYYLPGNWEPFGDYRHNLWPILIGPARGLFSFTPVLLFGLVGWAFKRQRKEPLFVLMWVWLALQTWMILRSKAPWGGWCYGPRFYTELVPGLALALLMTFESLELVKARIRNGIIIGFLVCAVFGIYLHTSQGLFSTATLHWNSKPNVDDAWRVVRWDWRYPQFLASPDQVEMRKRENEMGGAVGQLLDQVPAGGALLYGEPDPGVREFFAYWNRHDVLRKGKPVFNSPAAIRRAGFVKFWFPMEWLPRLQADSLVTIDPPIGPDSILGPDSVMVPAARPVLGHAVFR